MAKRAATMLEKPSVIAWDMIQEKGTGTPFILEANSAPGVSDPTAARITDMVSRLYINNEGE
jgi:D-alanine-D-alanine ligase-like ATP-grasp enzyme